MISSAIWDKSPQVNFSKTNRRADLSQNAREKSCDYLLHVIIYMQKSELLYSSFTCHRAPFVTAPCSRLQMTTSTKMVERSILMDETQLDYRKLKPFVILSFQLYMFSTAVSERNTIVTANKIPLLLCFDYLGFG